MIIDIEDARVARTFDGPSSQRERLEGRICVLGNDLHELTQRTITEPAKVIATAERLIELLRKLDGAPILNDNF